MGCMALHELHGMLARCPRPPDSMPLTRMQDCENQADQCEQYSGHEGLPWDTLQPHCGSLFLSLTLPVLMQSSRTRLHGMRSTRVATFFNQHARCPKLPIPLCCRSPSPRIGGTPSPCPRVTSSLRPLTPNGRRDDHVVCHQNGDPLLHVTRIQND